MKSRKLLAVFLACVLILLAFPASAYADEGTVPCPRCGESVPDYSNFCLYCGASLRPAENSELVLETETGRAELLGLAPVPNGFLTDETLDSSKLVMVLVKYTNIGADDRQFHNDFKLRAYQNGVELSDKIGSYYSKKCPEEYANYSKSILQNGSLTIGRIFILDDASDVTAIVSINGSGSEKARGTFALDRQPAAGGSGNTVSTDGAAVSNDIVDLHIGDTITTDRFEFTLNNVEFSYQVYPEDTSGYYRYYPADSGKVYLHIDGKYYNTSKQDACIRDLPVATADYNDGYTYKGFVIVDNGSRFTFASSYVVSEPLTSCHYHCLIECPEEVETSELPIFFTIKLGPTTYRYTIR